MIIPQKKKKSTPKPAAVVSELPAAVPAAPASPAPPPAPAPAAVDLLGLGAEPVAAPAASVGKMEEPVECDGKNLNV